MLWRTTSATAETAGDGFGVHILDSLLGRDRVESVRDASINEA